MSKVNVSPAMAVVAVGAFGGLGAYVMGRKSQTQHQQLYRTPSSPNGGGVHSKDTQPKAHDTKGVSKMGSDMASKKGPGEGARQEDVSPESVK